MAPKKKDDKGKAVEKTDSADDQKVAMETELQVAVLKSRLGRYRGSYASYFSQHNCLHMP